MDDKTDLTAQWAKEDTAHLEVAESHGSSLAELDAPLIIYNDRQQLIAKLNKRMMFAVPLVALYCVGLFMMGMQSFALGFLLYFAFLYLFVVRRMNKTVAPLLQIDSTGITVHSLITRCHVDWDNFQDARSYGFVYKFVGINPKSIWKLQATVPCKLFLMLNSISRLLFGLIGVKVFAINVPEQYSHFTAEEICEQIELRKNHFLALPDDQGHVLKLPKQQALPDAQAIPQDALQDSEVIERNSLKLPNQSD